MEDDLKISKVEYLSNHLLEHTQIVNLSLGDQTKLWFLFGWFLIGWFLFGRVWLVFDWLVFVWSRLVGFLEKSRHFWFKPIVFRNFNEFQKCYANGHH